MVYINLIDYLDKLELIQSHDGRFIKALHYFPDNRHYERILVVFEDGRTDFFSEKGIYSNDKSRSFVLKPKPKKRITGWRRGVFWSDGCFDKSPMFRPTKSEFERIYAGCTLFGPWESETIEIEED